MFVVLGLGNSAASKGTGSPRRRLKISPSSTHSNRKHMAACVAVKKAARSGSVRRDRAADQSGDLGGVRSVELFAAGRRGLQLAKKDARAHTRGSLMDNDVAKALRETTTPPKGTRPPVMPVPAPAMVTGV